MIHYITPKIKELTLYFSPINGAPFLHNKTDHYHPYISLDGIMTVRDRVIL